jgi:hypothetical protein
VIGVHVNSPSSNFQSAISALSLASTCN